ncbi:MAG: GYF domain-containing protein [Microthrixaceae bacterium]
MSDLPPLDQQQAYVVVGSNEQVGPYALELLISEVVAGRLADTTPVWWPSLTDWTTMAAHPGVAAEIARRRSAAGSAPGWAAPMPAQNPSSGTQPVSEPYSDQPYQGQTYEGQQGTSAAGYAQPGTEQPQPDAGQPDAGQPDAGQPDGRQPTIEAFEAAPAAPSAFEAQAPSSFEAPDGSKDSEAAVADDFGATGGGYGLEQDAGIVDSEIVDAEIVEARATESSVGASGDASADTGLVDDSTRATFNALVERSSRRAEAHSRVEAVDESFVSGVIATANSFGFGLDDRTDVDRRHELRFGEQSGGLLVISLAQILAEDPAQIRASSLPVTISYRADSTASMTGSDSAGQTSHGEIVVTPDEWTGQTTSSVSLFLSADDYLSEDLALDDDGLGRDIGAVIKVVRARLA